MTCCEMMEHQLELSCETHPELVGTPNSLVVHVLGGRWSLPVQGEGLATVEIRFCPWCGKELT